MSYEILLGEDAEDYLQRLDAKSRRIVEENLRKLDENPRPSPDSKVGDTEKVTVDGEEVYRMHIGRTHTAFYLVNEDKNRVEVVDLMKIDKAHKIYD